MKSPCSFHHALDHEVKINELFLKSPIKVGPDGAGEEEGLTWQSISQDGIAVSTSSCSCRSP